MKLRLAVLSALTCAGLFLVGSLPADDDPPELPEGVEVQTRGPVHEAYAEPTALRGAPGPVVSREPPAPIEESPPEEKPEGDNISWIPGYWSWDEEANEFLWVSGFWRYEPPGRDWVPGEWHKLGDGFQWVSGYWGIEGQEEEEYLPSPPESLDRGPAIPAPGPGYVYTPGTWVYQTTRYLWQPGQWIAYNRGWMWTPPCYQWTPAGFVHVRGYWDRPLADRGLLFAPVRFTRKVYEQRDFVYSPAYVIQPDMLVGSLFVRPATRGYYFGDYFDAGYRKSYVPWFDYRTDRVNPDVNYAHYRAAYGRHADWDRNLRTLYRARYDREIAPPPRTLVQQQKVINNITQNRTVNKMVNKTVNITNVQNSTVVQPVRKVKTVRATALASLANIRSEDVKSAPAPREMRIERVNRERVAEERKQVERYRAVGKERQAREGKMAAKAPAARLEAPVRTKKDLPRTVPPPRVRRNPVKPPPAPAAPRIDSSKPAPVPPKGRPPKKERDPVRPPQPPMPKANPVPPKGPHQPKGPPGGKKDRDKGRDKDRDKGV